MSESPPSTQQDGPSIRVYSWAILFNFDVDNEFPFSVVNLDDMKGTNFPFTLISGHLGLEDRLKPRQLSKFPGSKLCIFAKVEEGKYLCIHLFNYFIYFIFMKTIGYF